MRTSGLHPEASLDIEEIWEYIARDSLDAADRVISEIEAAISNVTASPEIGHRRPDLTSRPFRFLRLYEYLIAYVTEEDRLFVIAVLHGRRNPKLLASLLDDRQQ
jgi:plasmid stabilization system protein ParE